MPAYSFFHENGEKVAGYYNILPSKIFCLSKFNILSGIQYLAFVKV